MATYKLPHLAEFEWQQKVTARQTTPPASPLKGNRYIVQPTGTGAWSGHDNAIATYNGSSWDFTTPVEGFICWLDSGNALWAYGYSGASWAAWQDQPISSSASVVIDTLTVNSSGYITSLYVDHLDEMTVSHGIRINADIGLNVDPSASYPLNVYGGNDRQAAFISSAMTATGTTVVALGGYTATYGVKGSTRTVYGLQYGNWVGFNSGAVGDANLIHIGAELAGSICYAIGSGGFTIGNAYGIRAFGFHNSMGGDAFNYTTATNAYGGYFSAINGNAGTNNLTITNAYGAYIASVLNDADHLITNDYQLYIEACANAASTNKYQAVLAGTGAGTGIWLGGVTNNARLFASAASVLDLAIGATTILQCTASGFGYVAGVGGTVSQSTSKSTAVTLNKICGTITTHNASLAAGAVVSFQVTNSTVAATDVVIVNHDSGGTLGAYTINASGAAAGHYHIDIRNNTAGALGEALVIRFAVIKSCAS